MSSRVITPPWKGWQIIRRLGRGGFGTVFEIERDSFGITEKAAMKVISIPKSQDELNELRYAGYSDQEISNWCNSRVESIQKEYSLMVRLKGASNIMRCDDIDAVPHDDDPGFDVYIRMELLTPLQKLLRMKNQRMSEQGVVRLGTDICRALITCEKENIIHRDIKPENILVDENGEFKLGDFGIAREMSKTTRATVTGTENYMAPEMIKREKYGRDVDTYALGIVMYRILNNGRLPFYPVSNEPPTYEEAEEAQLKRVSGEQIPPPERGSRELDAIVLKATSFDRKNRYQSAAEMLADLEKLSDTTETPSTPRDDQHRKPAPKSEKKNETKKVFAIAMIAIIAVVIGAGYLLSRGSENSTKSESSSQATESSYKEYKDDSDITDANDESTGDGSITYEMWDNPDKGSAASNDDPYHKLYWNVSYDSSGRYYFIQENHFYDYEHCSEDEIIEYKDRLENDVYGGSEYDFVKVKYYGPATGNHGTWNLLQIDYEDLNDPAHRQLLTETLFESVQVGDTITDLDTWIRNMHGVVDNRPVVDEDDAIEFAYEYAVSHGYAEASDKEFKVVCNGTYEPSEGPYGDTYYAIHGYDDMETHVATLFRWHINQYGIIYDELTKEQLNG